MFPSRATSMAMGKPISPSGVLERASGGSCRTGTLQARMFSHGACRATFPLPPITMATGRRILPCGVRQPASGGSFRAATRKLAYVMQWACRAIFRFLAISTHPTAPTSLLGVLRTVRGTSSRRAAALYAVQWGLLGDIPVAGDFDGSGQAEFSIWRPSAQRWFILENTQTSSLQEQDGLAGNAANVWAAALRILLISFLPRASSTRLAMIAPSIRSED